jgi:hypothetical protein
MSAPSPPAVLPLSAPDPPAASRVPELPAAAIDPPAATRPCGSRGSAARAWRRFLAATRLSRSAVCEESAGLGEYDYHSYRDDADRAPWDVEGGRRCVRCGKRYRT